MTRPQPYPGRAAVVRTVYESLTMRHGWSVERATEQVCLDYSLTRDELRAIVR